MDSSPTVHLGCSPVARAPRMPQTCPGLVLTDFHNLLPPSRVQDSCQHFLRACPDLLSLCLALSTFSILSFPKHVGERCTLSRQEAHHQEVVFPFLIFDSSQLPRLHIVYKMSSPLPRHLHRSPTGLSRLKQISRKDGDDRVYLRFCHRHNVCAS